MPHVYKCIKYNSNKWGHIMPPLKQIRRYMGSKRNANEVPCMELLSHREDIRTMGTLKILNV